MKSGLILDYYDDSRGDVLRELWPDDRQVPAGVKTAHQLTREEHGRLPDQSFALVLKDGGQIERKYACVDRGNTELSIHYFLQQGGSLPESAQKVAAENLQIAAGWYGLEPVFTDALLKTAGMLNKAIFAATAPAIIKGTAREVQMRNAVNPIDGPIHTPKEVGAMLGRKTASLSPHCDITGQQAKVAQAERQAEHFCLDGRYPLDSQEDVLQAIDYFYQHKLAFTPAERHLYCTNAVKQAAKLYSAQACGEEMLRYAGDRLQDPAAIKIAFELRRRHIGPEYGEDAVELLDSLEKIALNTRRGGAGVKLAAEDGPLVLVGALERWDQSVGLDRQYDQAVSDPYYSLLKESAEHSRRIYSFIDGADYVNEDQLESCAVSEHKTICQLFGHQTADRFRTDPVGTFKALPRHQKKLVCRISSQAAQGVSSHSSIGPGV